MFLLDENAVVVKSNRAAEELVGKKGKMMIFPALSPAKSCAAYMPLEG
ncbi:MAG TPA: hypothetical protein DEA47_02920 [Peptococcaceae bacterium]|nr:hypothetical protein [Peptococcaceae bacterium]